MRGPFAPVFVRYSLKKLEGLDTDWSLPSSEDYSKYANLTPGKYIFKVRSCNNEGIWDTNETIFSFIIETPFYLTWWFTLIIVALVIGAVYAVFKIRILSIARQQRLEFNELKIK